MFRALDDKTLVAGQIRPDQLAGAAARGVTLIVNNRPDGEEPATLADLGTVSGVGAAKLERYGEGLLAALHA